jgi:hypothetical protein
MLGNTDKSVGEAALRGNRFIPALVVIPQPPLKSYPVHTKTSFGSISKSPNPLKKAAVYTQVGNKRRSWRIPPTPLGKGGFKVPLSKGDLGGFRSGNEAS